MNKLRGDLYPNLKDSPLWSREDLLDEYVEIAQKVFSRYFTSKMDVITYINNFRDSKDAEFFLDICRYYNISKSYEKSPFVKLVMIFSAIDKAARHHQKYLPFDEWITCEGNREKFQEEVNILKVDNWESFKKLMSKLKEQYRKTYGSIRNIADFLDKYLPLEDKVKIIRSFHFKRTKYAERVHYASTNAYRDIEEYAKEYRVKLIEGSLPECYDWRSCWIEYGRCHPKVKCRLYADNELLKKQFKKVLTILYHFRSEFVHEARISSNLPDRENFTIGIYENEIITIFIKMSDLEEIFEKALKGFFDALQTTT